MAKSSFSHYTFLFLITALSIKTLGFECAIKDNDFTFYNDKSTQVYAYSYFYYEECSLGENYTIIIKAPECDPYQSTFNQECTSQYNRTQFLVQCKNYISGNNEKKEIQISASISLEGQISSCSGVINIEWTSWWSRLSAGQVAGIIGGGAVLLIIVGSIIGCCCCRRRAKDSYSQMTN